MKYGAICDKLHRYRDRVLVALDDVDVSLDRDTLVFNAFFNKTNDFRKPVLESYFEVARAVSQARECPSEPRG